jgi:hypothetical protein
MQDLLPLSREAGSNKFSLDCSLLVSMFLGQGICCVLHMYQPQLSWTTAANSSLLVYYWCVQPGAYFYQFLVDGQWSVSDNSIVEPDEQGHLSNKVLCPDFGCCGGQQAKRCLAHLHLLNACEAPGVCDM